MNKKLLFLGLVITSFAIFLASCNKDETTVQPASLLFDPDSTSYTGNPGDQVTFQVSASAPSGFVSLTVDKTVDSGTPVTLQTVTDANADNVEVFNFTYTFLEEEVGKTVILTFTLSETGTAGVSKTKTIITNSPPARSYTATLLYAPLGDKSGESFFSTNTGATYSPDSVNGSSDPLSADIDFGYYYGGDAHASIASPAGYDSTVFSAQVAGWNTKNSTQIRSTDLTASQFNELSTMADIDAAFDAGTPEYDIIQGLTEGQVIAFSTDPDKTGGSKKGLILVKTISGTFNEGDYIELDILVQEPAE